MLTAPVHATVTATLCVHERARAHVARSGVAVTCTWESSEAVPVLKPASGYFSSQLPDKSDAGSAKYPLSL